MLLGVSNDSMLNPVIITMHTKPRGIVTNKAEVSCSLEDLEQHTASLRTLTVLNHLYQRMHLLPWSVTL